MSYITVAGLALVMALVLVLPFSVKKVEEELEAFLLVMGLSAMTISGLWSLHVVKEALAEPLKISAAVFCAGLLFRAYRERIAALAGALGGRLGTARSVFLLVTALGFLSGVITAIVAALVLCEFLAHLRLDREARTRVAVYACYAIGFGAALTPLGEPLSTIITAKLQGPPHQAGFFWLAGLLLAWVAPAIFVAAALAARRLPSVPAAAGQAAPAQPPEPLKAVAVRAGKVYVFVAALVFLGEGLRPAADRLLPLLKDWQLYWIGVSSAALDNATLAAAGITPALGREQILSFTLSLLISGGMLIPGNIPNIISAAKLGIRSREWAAAAVPPGLALLLACFLALSLLRP